MKTQVTLLALCLLGAGLANGQTSTNTNSSSGTMNSTTGTTTPTTTDVNSTSGTTSTYSTSPSSVSTTDGSTMNNGTMNAAGSTNSNGTMNSATSPAYGTTTTTTDVYNTTDRTTRDKSSKNYKNFVFGVYGGLNTTKFKGETLDTDGDLSGRLGYQLGFFVRGGGRLYGQVGAEYFASSSNYFTTGSGQNAASIQDQINIKYIQVPVYIGYKLVESDRGISAVRLQAGLEYANQIGSDANRFGSLDGFKIKSGTFNGLGQLGFDIGPLLIDLTYHYGFSDAVNGTGFNGSQRRILSASVGFKF